MSMKNINRNDPCPCGSGKKYKQCCLKRDEALAEGRRAETTSTPKAIQDALGHYQAGRTSQAEAICQQVLHSDPSHPDALHLLGVIAYQAGQLEIAVALIGRAIRANPSNPQCYNNLGNALKDMGRPNEAVESYRQALARDPNFAGAHYNLGLVLQSQGQLEAAIESYQKAVALRQNYAEAHNNLGLALQSQGKLDAAVGSYRMALSFQPDFAKAQCNLANVLKDQGMLDAAVESYRKALSLKPDFAEAHIYMGDALQAQGKLDAAVESYRLALSFKPDDAITCLNLGNTFLAQGKLDAAVVLYQKVLSLDPDNAVAHNNLGNALLMQGKFDSAVASYNNALSLNQNDAVAYNNLGNVLLTQGKPDAAVENFHKALSLKPDFAEAHNNLGNALKDQGKLNDAIEHYRNALFHKPSLVDAHSNLLHTLNFHSGMSREEVYRESHEFEALRGYPLRLTWPAHSNDRDPDRRLRIGYVSPDFRNHPVAHFTEPIFANHDKSQVEIFCYAELKLEDEVTSRFRQLADHWHSTVGLSDDAAANMIRDHRIDILVDLAGHTAHNRLLVFARKPAPIQITYLGYPGTTGLSAMDYRLTDHYADPDGIADAYYSERLLRLPGSLWCYRPSADMPETAPLPALSRGYLSFGSFNNFNKIDQPTLDLWAELLQALPASRLMMLTVPGGDARQRLVSRFEQLGISAQRLEFHGKLPAIEFHRKFLEVDISLDPVTVNGATTTCESLWMGVPVMSLAGDRFLTRAGLSILTTAGLADFAAASRKDYFRIATHLADNLPLLAEIRAGLREHIRTSPLVDEAGFTRNLENLYRDVWGKWCGAT
jgi:predicted O-linked N-acetylglucosamine transferase (SPINDLY family)